MGPQPANRLSICAATLLAWTLTAAGQELSLNLDLIRTKYCLEPSGLVTLRLQLRMNYRNDGPQPVILFRLPPVQSFVLRDGKNEPGSPTSESHHAFAPYRVFDGSKIGRTAPRGDAFTILAAGATYQAIPEDLIIVLKDNQDREPVLGTDQYLTVEANPWPDHRKNGEALRRVWKGSGFLWLDPVQSSALKIHIEETPQVARCGPPAVGRSSR
jgi:hypothetical protein